MPLPIIADTCRVAIRGVTANGQPWVNVLHLTHDGGWDFAFIDANFDDISAIYATNSTGGDHGWAFFAASPAATIDWTFTELNGSAASITINSEVTGVAAQQQLPGECALICSHLTAERGKSKRGRTFWSSPYEGLTSADGTLTGSVALQVQEGWTSWRDDLLAPINVTHVVASYLSSSVTPVTTTVARDYFGHQDRRRR